MSELVKKNTLFPAFFDDFFTKDFINWNDKNFTKFGSTLPSANIKEDDKTYMIQIAVPGLRKEDFEIEYKNGILSVSSEKKVEKEDKDKEGNYIRKEFTYSTFQRTFSLPEDIMEDKIEANYKEGILTVNINKKEVKPVIAKKTIMVK
ncbi:MAG: Hsp20/alpha crystallin family protein [Saprospiraceae bacterium]|nr:Hsp20/alpha crystallin family protein [Saprospiraceae bacterium]